MIKMEIRSATISYSKSKCKRIRDREHDILFKLDLLDNTICNNFSSPDIDETLQEYENLKSELKLIYEEKGKPLELNVVGRKRREANKVYFFNLEKRNYNKKTISELRLQDESTTNNENVILDQIDTL